MHAQALGSQRSATCSTAVACSFPRVPPASNMRSTTAPKESESAFQQAVLDLAALTGWRAYHTHNSRHSAAGFPDLVLVRPPRLIFAELKTEKGRASVHQAVWLDDLGAVAEDCEPIEVHLWRPSNWPDITTILS